MATIDLDKSRAARDAARAEKGETGHSIIFGGETFDLPVEMPAEFAFAYAEGRLWDAVLALFDAEQAKAFRDHRPTLDDLVELSDQASDLYMGAGPGAGPGESKASGKSSRRTSKRSRPTSSASTA